MIQGFNCLLQAIDGIILMDMPSFLMVFRDIPDITFDERWVIRDILYFSPAFP